MLLTSVCLPEKPNLAFAQLFLNRKQLFVHSNFQTTSARSSSKKIESLHPISLISLNRKQEIDEALTAIGRAISLGINFFDTSPYYGTTLSETILGNCLYQLAVTRDQIIISTKCGRYADGFDFSAERVIRSIDESLGRLRLDYVDIFHCHDIEFGLLDQIINETIPALQKIKAEGKTRFIAISGLPLGICKFVLDRVPIGSVDVILSYYHYCINDSTLLDLIPYLKTKGVGLISASPLAMGLLTENGPPDWHPASPEIKSRMLRSIVRRRGRTFLR